MPARRHIALLAGLGSLGMLLGAFAFQYAGGLNPCPMCLWQRWPHALAALLGFGVLLGGPLVLLALGGALSMAVSTVLAVLHSGVERDWWTLPLGCTSGGDLGGMSSDDLFDQIMAAPLVRCDEIAWSLFGLTMPNWNALISLGLAGLWIVAMLRRA